MNQKQQQESRYSQVRMAGATLSKSNSSKNVKYANVQQIKQYFKMPKKSENLKSPVELFSLATSMNPHIFASQKSQKAQPTNASEYGETNNNLSSTPNGKYFSSSSKVTSSGNYTPRSSEGKLSLRKQFFKEDQSLLTDTKSRNDISSTGGSNSQFLNKLRIKKGTSRTEKSSKLGCQSQTTDTPYTQTRQSIAEPLSIQQIKLPKGVAIKSNLMPQRQMVRSNSKTKLHQEQVLAISAKRKINKIENPLDIAPILNKAEILTPVQEQEIEQNYKSSAHRSKILNSVDLSAINDSRIDNSWASKVGETTGEDIKDLLIELKNF